MFWAVDGVTIRVEPGHILALLGQNGAGKTTTVRMLSALLMPDARYGQDSPDLMSGRTPLRCAKWWVCSPSSTDSTGE